MSYLRVIPRDLFNESKLLKCLGQIALLIHDRHYPTLKLVHKNPRIGFKIVQDEDSGDLSCSNLRLMCRGKEIKISTNYNSRQSFPMFFSSEEDGYFIVDVFTNDGRFTDEFLEFIGKEN